MIENDPVTDDIPMKTTTFLGDLTLACLITAG